MGTKGNEYIRKAKRKRKIRKMTFLMVLIVVVMVGIAYKSPLFLIKNLQVVGEKNLSEANVLSMTEGLKGENIFFISSKEISSALTTLPYVDNVEVIKKYPSTLQFKIKQKEAAYYIESEGEYLILSSDLQIIDKVYDLTIPNIMLLNGVSIENTEMGKQLKEIDERNKKVLHTFYEINKLEKVTKKIESIDISDLGNIKVYIGNIECLLGSDQEIIEKMEFVFDATSEKNNLITEGYIDVRTLSSPIINNHK
ncbi:MAG: cell division protein FtsQ/DivIB [Clostridium sp.]